MAVEVTSSLYMAQPLFGCEVKGVIVPQIVVIPNPARS
jgi:hypothetical protein